MKNATLPTLRAGIQLHQGPNQPDGSPSWTLEDPVRNRFYRLGWLEFQLLSRWRLSDQDQLVKAVNSQTALTISGHDVSEFSKFLTRNELVQQSQAKPTQTEPTAWYRWLLHNYLFMRIPLVRPDAWLQHTQRWAALFYSPLFLLITLLAALTGLLLTLQRWDSFTHTFLHFFSFEGALLAALTLLLTKVCHELGHAYTCKRYGGQVATMGVALLVLWPVLYTDTTTAWRLASRRQRLLIGAAGMLAELIIASWATLLWHFLPDGMLRSAAFLLATTTWILTLTINLSPFMRFDGYFLLCDLLNMPNLQQRAFAYTRWKIRVWLFGDRSDAPEPLSPTRERLILFYTGATWIYRLILFTGIALLVYHMTFKILGIFLFLLEITMFIAKPILSELRYWYHHHLFQKNRQTATTLIVLSIAAALLFIPWRTHITAPALMRASDEINLVVTLGSQLIQKTTLGSHKQQGQTLFKLQSPELEHEITQLHQHIQTLQWQNLFQRMDADAASHLPVVQQELNAALQHYQRLLDQRQSLTLKAPFDGVLIETPLHTQDAQWSASGEWLGTFINPATLRFEAFVEEHDLDRVQIGSRGRYYSGLDTKTAIPLEVVDIERTATQHLSSVAELASTQGGDIAARNDTHNQPIAEQAIYRVALQPISTPSDDMGNKLHPLQVSRGTLVLDAPALSFASRAYNATLAVLIRESGF